MVFVFQTVIDAVQRALVDAGRQRPRYPGLGNKESALLYCKLNRALARAYAVLQDAVGVQWDGES
jgi:hypothetical protein